MPAFYKKIVEGLDGLHWTEATKNFYRQREVNLAGHDYYDDLFSKSVRGQIATSFGQFFGIELGADFDIAAHKMVKGDFIGVHTDFNNFGESHRVTILLNEEWTAAEGGILLALNGNSLAEVRDAWLPTANNAFLFEISERSYHAVTPIVGERPRFSMILTFRRPGCAETAVRPIWIPFPLQSDIDSATSTALLMGISSKTFDGRYEFKFFKNIADFQNLVDGRLDNAPPQWSYCNGASINVDQHGRQPRGDDLERVQAVSQLRRIPPIIVVRLKSGGFCLVDGSHRLSYSNDNAAGLGVAFFDEC